MSSELRTIALTRSQLCERTIRWEDKPLSLVDYPMLVAPYNGAWQRTLLKTSRQIGKSIMLMVKLLTDSLAQRNFKSLFVTPTKEQTQKFSTSRVAKAINGSPHIRDNFIDSSLPSRVGARSFSNGSEIAFTYASDDGDRVRGNSADHTLLDETQDILLDAVRSEIRECLRNSEFRRETYCGTPKTLENDIEQLWVKSSQTEWAIKCDSCGKYSIIVNERQLGKWGPICGSCKAYLNPRNGTWVDTNPDPTAPYKGFHISRPIMVRGVPACWPEGPLRDKARKEWAEILGTLEGPDAYGLPQFRNEVLGISDSVGQRLVSEDVLLSAMDGPAISPKPTPELMQGVQRLAAGIDWSGGGADGHSFTVLTILGKLNTGRIRVLYFKIFPGLHAVQENEEIRGVLRNYDMSGQLFVAGDAGEGNMNMDMLRSAMPNPARVVKIRYTGPDAQHYVRWDQSRNSYIVNRTTAIDSAMMAMVRKEFQFPREPQAFVRAAFRHILAEYEETTSRAAGGRKVWRHASTMPDDFLHSLVFGRIALQIATGEINLGSASPS